MPNVTYTVVENCRKEIPIAEVQGACNMLIAYCRELGQVTDSAINNNCMFPLVLKENVILLEHQDANVVTNCANDKYSKDITLQQKISVHLANQSLELAETLVLIMNGGAMSAATRIFC